MDTAKGFLWLGAGTKTRNVVKATNVVSLGTPCLIRCRRNFKINRRHPRYQAYLRESYARRTALIFFNIVITGAHANFRHSDGKAEKRSQNAGDCGRAILQTLYFRRSNGIKNFVK